MQQQSVVFASASIQRTGSRKELCQSGAASHGQVASSRLSQRQKKNVMSASDGTEADAGPSDTHLDALRRIFSKTVGSRVLRHEPAVALLCDVQGHLLGAWERHCRDPGVEAAT